jgi:hypothetical protein
MQYTRQTVVYVDLQGRPPVLIRHETSRSWNLFCSLLLRTESNFPVFEMGGLGFLSRYSDLLPAGRSGSGGRDFPHPSRPVLGPTQPPGQWVPGLLPGAKGPGRGVTHSPPSSAEVKEKVELYIYSPCGPSWPVVA